MNGKGDRNRTTDREAFRENYEQVFGDGRVVLSHQVAYKPGSGYWGCMVSPVAEVVSDDGRDEALGEGHGGVSEEA